MPDAILFHAAPETSPDLFHVIPAGIVDPFTYVEVGDRRVATVSVLDADKVEPLGIEIADTYALGRDELQGRGLSRDQVDHEIALRLCRELGVTSARVPPTFPLAVADHLRAGGIELVPDEELFVERRRTKSGAQLDGIRRAQRAADAAMAVAAEMIHAGGTTAEDVRAAMQAVCEERGCELPDDVVVAPGAQGAVGHDSGSGPLGDGEPVVVDIWPRDKASRCWADMTRTFIAGGGEPSEEIARYWALTRESLRRIYPMIRAGADCPAIFAASW